MKNPRLVQVFNIFAISCAAAAFLSGLNSSIFTSALAFLVPLAVISILIERYKIHVETGTEISFFYKTMRLVRLGEVVSRSLIFLFSLILAAKTISFFTQMEEFDRADWLHHYSDHPLFFFLILLWPLLVCMFFYKYHRSKIAPLDILLLASTCAMMLLDGTRIAFLFFALSWLIFRQNPLRPRDIVFSLALLVGAIITVSFVRLTGSSADILSSFYQNLFHSFAGGFFLYSEHGAEIIQTPALQYDRSWIIKSVPGLDIFFSTIFDKVAGTDWSLTHFASIFWQMNEFIYVESLGVPMNSYYTAIILKDLLGIEVSLLLMIPILFSAAQSGSFFSKLSTFWLCGFLVTFSMYLININMGFALIFLVCLCHGLIVMALQLRSAARGFLTPK